MQLLHVEGETSQLLMQTDWSRTPLGPIEHWPRSLLSYVSMIMELPSPAIVFWGPEQTQIYNDGYALLMGPRHPRHFGSPYRECWPDTYPLIYPWMRRVLDHGELIGVDRERIPVTRYGFEEDAYFTFTFSPLRDDAGRIAGILQPVFEVTDAVLSDRRSETLRALQPQVGVAETVAGTMATLAANPGDISFAAVHLWDSASRSLRLCGRTPQAPSAEAIEQAVQRCFDQRETVQVEAPAAFVLPLDGQEGQPPLGTLALGLSPRLHFDERYRAFLQAVAAQLAVALQRSEAMLALERHRAYLDDLFLQAPAGISVTEGPDHVFRLVNPLSQQLVAPGRELVGRPLREALPELRDQPVPAMLDQVYATGEACVGVEDRVVLDRGNGPEESYFNFVYQPLKDAHGRTTGILMFSYDVTQQVLDRQRTEALTEELRQEHRRKDEFLAMLAHELRNPLAPISSAADVLRRGQLDAARVRRASEIIARQVRHMAGLVNDLLDVSRVTRGLVTLDRLEQDMKHIVLDAVEQVRPLVEARRHRLRMDLPAQTAHVLGDEKRLVQVLANLLTNAARYTPEGGQIDVSLNVADDTLTVHVQDNGVGIAESLLPRVFDLFVQAERSADRTQGGLGIGLALVKSLVELHGGAVACESRLGQGSRFIVQLPRLVAPAFAGPVPHQLPHQLPHETPQRAAGPLRVLVVDDNQDAAHMLAMQLESAGHQVLVEHDPRDAYTRACTAPLELAFIDIGLPHEDGNSLARRLRAHAATRGMVLVAVTGYGQESNRSESLEAGFDHFLVKPALAGQIEAIVAQAHLRNAAGLR